MGVNMDEARQRFDEASPMIIDALETGFIEGSGPFYPQKRIGNPSQSARFLQGAHLSGRHVAGIRSSVCEGGRADGDLRSKAMGGPGRGRQGCEYKAAYKTQHGNDAPPIMICDFTYCDTDPARAKELGQKYVTNYLLSALDHHELADEHFKDAKGHEVLRSRPSAPFAHSARSEWPKPILMSSRPGGRPREIVEQFEYRKSLLGEFDINPCFLFGGMSYEECGAESMRVRPARHVMPTPKKQQT